MPSASTQKYCVIRLQEANVFLSLRMLSVPFKGSFFLTIQSSFGSDDGTMRNWTMSSSSWKPLSVIDGIYREGTDGGGTGVCRSEMGVRSILIKFCCLVCPFGFLFHAGLDPHLMTARRGRRTAAAAAEREVKRARYHPSVVAGGRGLGDRFVAQPLQGGCVGGRDGTDRGGSVRCLGNATSGHEMCPRQG